jgi:putative hydroxymethylpyrimidine transport system permease protein
MNAGRLARPAVIFVGLLAVWQAVVLATGAPPFILPGPIPVAVALATRADFILGHAGVTIVEILAGFAIGTVVGTSSALAMSYFRPARRWLMPVLVVSQAVPVFALAPLLTLWLGYGMGSKIVMVVLIFYFPVTSAFFDGLMRTPKGLLDLATVMGASSNRQILRLRVPHAMPSLASGLRLAAVYAPFGAVIGEWVGASKGLGYLMLLANGRAQTDLMFACLFVLAAFTVMLYLVIDRAGLALSRRFAEPTG